MKVLCFGSLNIDFTYQVDHFVQKGETLSSDSLQVFPGGKGLNQSIALARAGAETFHAGCIGDDGQFLLDTLRGAGVDTSLIRMVREVKTGNAIIQNDREGDNCILLYGGANQAITKEQARDVISRFSEGDYLLLQNEINELPYIMELAHERGMKIVLNPSPMNGKIFDLPLSAVDYFLLNEVEAGQLLQKEIGKDADMEALAAEVSARFPKAAIVLTIGSEGSIYCKDGMRFTQPVYPVKAVDTTAAGDTFTGYFIAGLLEGASEKEAMDLAARAAAIAVTRRGAAPSVPEKAEVLGFSR